MIEVACPKCQKSFELDERDLRAPAGQIAYARCPGCGHKGREVDFERERERLRAEALKEERRRIREEEGTNRRRAEEEARAAREAAAERERKEARESARAREAEARAHERELRDEIRSLEGKMWVFEEDADPWKNGTRVMAVISLFLCWTGGFMLIAVQSEGGNTIFEAIAHGIGVYCLGKGCFVGQSLWNSKHATRGKFGRSGVMHRLPSLRETQQREMRSGFRVE